MLIHRPRFRAFIATMLLLAGLAGCTVEQQQQPASQPRLPPQAAAQNDRVSGPVRPANPGQQAGKIAEVYRGAGTQSQVTTLGGRGPAAVAPRPAGDITLNFEDADVREVAQVVLRDLLRLTYTIDPDVQGRVTFRTANPLTREQLLPALESLLRANDLALSAAGGVYRVSRAGVVASGSGLSAPRAPSSAGGSGTVRVFPLRFVSADEMGKILKPVVGESRVLLTDAARSLVVVQGSANELRLAAETIQVFDIDQLIGQTVLLESLLNADAGTLALELENLFQSGKSGMLDGAVRIIPIERMNAIMVITAQPRYIEEARNWIARLDRTRNAAQRRLFVYYMQNGKAASVARTLRGIYGLGDGGGNAAPARGQSLGSQSLSTGNAALGRSAMSAPALTARGQPNDPSGLLGQVRNAQSAAPGEGEAGVRIFADEANNAILALATPSEYQSIEETLSKLDLVPLQVLIEASIVEVALNDTLRFGVQYYLNGDPFNESTGVAGVLNAVTRPALPGGLVSALDAAGANAGGFSLFLTRGGTPRVVLDALSSITELNMISSPSLLVLDNQVARLQVGSAVPIITQSVVAAPSGSVTPTGNSTNIANAIDYRDTGVMLEVVPRVNASGLVTLEIAQEVSDVSQPVAGATIQSPTINQRRIVSTVAVSSGETVVLGGLIRDGQSVTDRGLPGLHSLPIIGPLFGTKGNASSRTELMVMLTPKVIRNQREARDASQDLQRKFQAVLTLMGRGINPAPRNPQNVFAD